MRTGGKTGNDHLAEKNKKCTSHTPFFTQFHSHLTHPVFVIHNIAQHVIHIQNASISMFQPVDLDPVAGVLEEKKEREY